MSAPKLDAQPGARFTDPDGGTWVLSDDDRDNDPWDVRRATGTWGGWHSQEEAENAGLIELVAEDDAHAAAWARESAAAGMVPAPLHPANPEHLREVAELLRMVPSVRHAGGYWLACSARECEDNADRLDREAAEAEQGRAAKAERDRLAELIKDAYGRAPWGGNAFEAVADAVIADRVSAEAEQDAKDRERAEEIALEHDDFCSLESPGHARFVAAVLAGIRAGRAAEDGDA